MKEIKQILYNDELYPQKLKNIKNPPQKLYAIGNLDLLKKDCLAIIGTRDITEYGIQNCKNFARGITKRGIPIVSGMALGTDSVAHKTALEYGGETIAVLGGGFNHIFPTENIGLFENIIERNGLVLTEYSENVIAKGNNFLERNRIVSGLSEGVLVIEAGYRSGTSVTAKLAYSQGKVVMALPGKLDNPYGVGVNRLIQEGAKLVTNVDDILQYFPQFSYKMWKSEIQNQITFFDVKEEYQEIVKILKRKTLSADEIFEKSSEKNLRNILQLLMNMELDGVIEQEIGVGYKLKI